MTQDRHRDNVRSESPPSIPRVLGGALVTGLTCAVLGLCTGSTIGGNMDGGFWLAGHHYRNEFDTGQLGVLMGLILGVVAGAILLVTKTTRLSSLLVVIIASWLMAVTLSSIVWVTTVNVLGSSESVGKFSALITLAIGGVVSTALMSVAVRKLA